jgi:hypothetical protein
MGVEADREVELVAAGLEEQGVSTATELRALLLLEDGVDPLLDVPGRRFEDKNIGAEIGIGRRGSGGRQNGGEKNG